MTITATACFEPSSKIREIREDLFVGKMATLRLLHKNNGGTRQYVQVEHPLFREYGFYINGWVNRCLGEDGDTIKRKITAFKLVEHKNGGRSWGEYSSYREFFDEERKQKVHAHWSGGILGRIMKPGGDPDQADIIVRLGELEIDSYCYSLVAPEEWYSELHEDNPKFKFLDGFYDSAEAAKEIFRQKSHDDIFGTRFFPTVVFPADMADTAKDIACSAKSCSKPIIVNDRIVIGTRCKPYEYEGVIERTYEQGGQIPIGVEWDWD